MFDLKTILTSALTAVVVVVLAGLVGGNQSDQLGASGTRFPNGISTDSTSPTVGQIRGTSLTITGATTLTGALSAPASGNKLGSDTSVNYTYYGAGDGCTAVFFTSSSTQVTQPTSTAFCN